MCISNGSPTHPLHKEGVQELWDLLRNHNAVFIGDSTLANKLDELLKEHQIERKEVTDKQREYTKIIAKLVDSGQLAC